jgi:hypothetical protein
MGCHYLFALVVKSMTLIVLGPNGVRQLRVLFELANQLFQFQLDGRAGPETNPWLEKWMISDREDSEALSLSILFLWRLSISPARATPRANVLALGLSPVWPLNFRDHLGCFPVSDP